MPAARLPRWANRYPPRGFAPRSARRYTKPRGSPLLATGTTSAVPLRGVNFARRSGVSIESRLTGWEAAPAGSRSGCAQSGRSQATPRHDPRPPPQHLLQPCRMGRRSPSGPRSASMRNSPFVIACALAEDDEERPDTLLALTEEEQRTLYDRIAFLDRLRPGDVRTAAGKRPLHVRGARLSGTCRVAPAEAAGMRPAP